MLEGDGGGLVPTILASVLKGCALSYLPPQRREASFDLCWGSGQNVLSQNQKQTFLSTSSGEKQPAAPSAAHPGVDPGESSSKEEGSVSDSNQPSLPALT